MGKNMDEQTKANPPSRGWLWAILAILTIGAVGAYLYSTKFAADSSQNTGNLTSSSPMPTISASETWQKESDLIMENVTSTDTHVISDDLVRTYYLGQEGFVYAESTNGAQTYSNPVFTGVTEDEGKFMSNPAVLEIASGKWIMIYEQQPRKEPGGSGQSPPGPKTQRDLYLATSTDGKKFTKVGLVLNSSKEDDYFASVPDLVLLPDKTIRMYYVSGGDAIGSAVSSDEGRTWKRDEGYRLQNGAVDPDIIFEDNLWKMYYSNINSNQNAIYLSTSSDGLSWQTGAKIVDRSGSTGSIVDPDVFFFGSQKMMLFGEFSSSDSTNSQETPQLYKAIKQ